MKKRKKTKITVKNKILIINVLCKNKFVFVRFL